MKKIFVLIISFLSFFQFAQAKNVVLDPSLDLSRQLMSSNTTYIIRDDIRVTKNITIPDNCVLQFEGGCITGNCVLTGKNTYITSAPVRIFSEGVSISGNWLNISVYPEWFGAVGDGRNDDRLAIQSALDSPISVVILSKKDYLIASHYPGRENIGLVIPSQKKVEGNAMNGWSRYYSISASPKLSFDTLVQLGGYQIEIKGIAVYGSTSNEYSKFRVKDLLATRQDKFYTSLTLENVYASSCLNNCYNLYTYNSSLRNCYADRGNVGFYIHGGNGRGTTISMHMCYAERQKAKAYFLSKISYSSLQLCAADHCGLGTIDNTHSAKDIYGYNYCYEDCRAISEISCGHEAGGYSHYLNDSRGIIFQTGRYTSDGLSKYADWKPALNNNMWVIKSSYGVKVENCTMATGMDENMSFFQQDSSTVNTVIENCDFTNRNGSLRKLTDKNIKNKESINLICIY